ncbi:uncharacterized protein BXZ73DRAFT_96338 [Epithele typhae]|uniref:uncharacterized protein n=1 Tax=Epithele typhae TaxID=378194 RepID=UPI0020072CC5|nr:uncharacterized protein BXZ73DRAFT_96338 [Epithele typhae]KAH9945347.1 hypothetical protein BXZ73DRAFT_96338 [Epithele typhae]
MLSPTNCLRLSSTTMPQGAPKAIAFSPEEAMAMYPSRAEQVSPPPTSHRALRDRCGVTLNIRMEYATAGSTKPRRLINAAPGNINTEPHHAKLPRRKVVAKIVHPASPKPETPVEPPAPTPISQPPAANDPQLQEILPAMHVCFGNAHHARRMGFTHCVEVVYTYAEPQRDRVLRGGDVKRLRLTLPRDVRERSASRLRLTEAQLLLARDFMLDVVPAADATKPAGDVKILVSVPAGRPTEAMCIAGTYLAHAADRDAEEILRCIDEEEEAVLSVWKGEVSEIEAAQVNKVAFLPASTGTCRE